MKMKRLNARLAIRNSELSILYNTKVLKCKTLLQAIITQQFISFRLQCDTQELTTKSIFINKSNTHSQEI